MGIIFSRVRKKKSTIETLEKLDSDIKEIEENRINAQRKYKKITKLFLVYSVALYFICGLFFYFQFTPTFQEKLLYLVPLAFSPILLYIVKRIISWYYSRLLNKNQKRLNEMIKEKKRILDEVMDKETYKVAKEILEKFSNEPVSKPTYNMQLSNVPNEGLRKRIVTPTTSVPRTPLSNNRGMMGNQTPRPIISSPGLKRAVPAPATPVIGLAAPILPLQRSYMDKVVEYLIGDGPNNRYALICSRCHSHNGMALKEEFEYIGFKCCYCLFYNPPRKIRPEAPKLEMPSKSYQESDTDSSERTSAENSDTERMNSGEKSIGVSEELNLIDDLSNDVYPKAPDLSNDVHPKTPDLSTNEIADQTQENAAERPVQSSSTLKEPEVQNSPMELEDSNQPESNADCDQSVQES